MNKYNFEIATIMGRRKNLVNVLANSYKEAETVCYQNYPKKWFVVSEYFNPIMESVKTNQIFAKPYIDILTGKYIKKSKIPSVKLKIDPITGRSHWFIT